MRLWCRPVNNRQIDEVLLTFYIRFSGLLNRCFTGGTIYNLAVIGVKSIASVPTVTQLLLGRE